ncbi:hypothetical protein [Xanthomonas arboricola]|uniref:hypothetical protein n=1 Tax=Xanthomonas arboricola TaxID=56448 RepID=UPI000C85BF20|nr:hypothetical protein [Xanthomonas arboricola]PPU28678.1 hypothetical protein XarCFBP6762_05360 [Xanthomonas arboricola]SOT99601.1 hypothetical protein CFBP6762_02250 [Xanthomonas arboricola pv. fragariae]
MKKLVLAALAASVVSACAQNIVFNKAGATDSDFQTDKSACEYEAMKYAGGYDPSLGAVGQGIDMAMRRNELTKACLQQKGWTPERR